MSGLAVNARRMKAAAELLLESRREVEAHRWWLRDSRGTGIVGTQAAPKRHPALQLGG